MTFFMIFLLPALPDDAVCFLAGLTRLKLLPLFIPLPFIANSVGWYITEAGRQPWIVVGLQRTAEAVSPNLTPGEVWLTLIGFTGIYLLLAVLALFAALHHIRKTKVNEAVD